mmetsp:Transcript_43280/g.71513  ORF Transcript_43280/g.71513 Transcript_43280/m.71513 type:complete len:258 (+) Transcript_43280:45-818(+)
MEIKSLQSKAKNLALKVNCPQSWNKYYVTLVKKYEASHLDVTESFNPKRIVFISINGLYTTWKECPPTSLFNALFILPVGTDWIKSPFKYDHQYSELLQNPEFNYLLQWKLSQGLLFCALDSDGDDSDDGPGSISPMWRKLSSRLQELYDPLSKLRYQSLMFDDIYWKHNSSLSRCSHGRFTVNVQDVILELCVVRLKFKCVERILVESNATLNVITHFQTGSCDDDNHSSISPSISGVSLSMSSSSFVSLYPDEEY